MPLTRDEDLARLLADTRHIALVGASDRADRPSHKVMAALLAHGYDVTPVNPALAGQQVLGKTVVADLGDIAEPIDLVDIFRNAEAAGPVVDAAIAVGAKGGLDAAGCDQRCGCRARRSRRASGGDGSLPQD